jgi:hypothetical protein
MQSVARVIRKRTPLSRWTQQRWRMTPANTAPSWSTSSCPRATETMWVIPGAFFVRSWFFFMLPYKCCLAILVVVLGPDPDPVAGSEFETSQPVLNPELTLISYTVRKGVIGEISWHKNQISASVNAIYLFVTCILLYTGLKKYIQ